jgi:hypothetical protein
MRGSMFRVGLVIWSPTAAFFLYEKKLCLTTKTISGIFLLAMNLKVDRRKLVTLSNI